MTLTFRTEGPWGAGKGGNLTPAEVDDNFWSLKTTLDNLGDELVPAEIDNITLTGNELRIFLEDGREFGPFLVPRASFRWRETFTPGQEYFGNDVIEVPGRGLYLVLRKHTADASFDPARTVDGNPAYQLIFAWPTAGVATVSDGVFSPEIGDEGNYFRCTNASGTTVEIPTDEDQPFEQGTEFHFRQAADGAVLLQAAGTVAINGIDGFLMQSATRGAVVTVKKVAAEEWDLFGYLAEDTS